MRLFLYIIKKFQFFLYFQDIVFSFIAVLWQKFSVFLKETVHTFIQVLLCRQFTFSLLRAIYCQTTSGKTPHLWKSALGRWGNEVFKIFPRVGLDSQGKLPCAAKVGLIDLTQSLVRSSPRKPKNFQDSPSHQIFQHMHEH